MVNDFGGLLIRSFVIFLLLLIPAVHVPAAHAADKQFMLQLQNRKVVSSKSTIRVSKGDRITLVWRSDEKGEIHLHGYDITLTLTPNTPTILHFDATVSGRFPITSHGFGDDHGHAHNTLLYIEVYPD